MKLKHIAMAGAISVLSTGALADDFLNVPVGVISGTALFGATHLQAVPFTDSFDFLPSAGSWLANAQVITIGFTPPQNIDFTSVKLNGNPLALSGPGAVEWAFTPAQLNVVGPLQLVVQGVATAATDVNSASYSGTLNIVAIPEPDAYAMLLAGLGIMGFIARRRMQNVA